MTVVADNVPNKSNESEPGTATGADPSDTGQVDHITRMQQELSAARDQALRAAAELENYRKRVQRDMQEERKYASVAVVRELLPVVDDIDRAIASAEQSHDAEALLDGIKMVRKQLAELLTNQGVQQVPAQGAEFDPAIHEAIMQQTTDEHPPGTVVQVAKEGYRMHDRVVRPAQVVVSKPAAE